jgi:hypothetical protein
VITPGQPSGHLASESHVSFTHPLPKAETHRQASQGCETLSLLCSLLMPPPSILFPPDTTNPGHLGTSSVLSCLCAFAHAVLGHWNALFPTFSTSKTPPGFASLLRCHLLWEATSFPPARSPLPPGYKLAHPPLGTASQCVPHDLNSSQLLEGSREAQVTSFETGR